MSTVNMDTTSHSPGKNPCVVSPPSRQPPIATHPIKLCLCPTCHLGEEVHAFNCMCGACDVHAQYDAPYSDPYEAEADDPPHGYCDDCHDCDDRDDTDDTDDE